MKLLRLRGLFKGFFFFMRLHLIFPHRLWEFFAYTSKLSKWIREQSKKGYSDFYSFKFDHNKRYELYAFVIEKEELNCDIDFMEFGVSKGNSFRWWVNRIDCRDARFYGFDTFSGLPEDWGPFKKGDMDNDNKPPEIDDLRHKFYQGIFQQTLPEFLKEYQPAKRKVIHLDADLYSSTLFVLTSLSPFINRGDILFFDEFNVPLHEFKAFVDWTQAFYVEYEILGSVNNFYQTAIEIKSI